MLAPPVAHHVGASRLPEPHWLLAQLPTGKWKSWSGGKEPKCPEHVHHAADADVPEKIFRGLGAALSGLVDLGRRHRFREGKLRIFHHDPAHQGNEEHPEDAADHDQRGGFPVGVAGLERRPCLRQSGKREW